MNAAILLLAAILLTSFFTGTGMAGGLTTRHLACAPIKDSIGKGTAPLQAIVFVPGVTCVAKLPAKQLCRTTEFFAPNPQPPRAPNLQAPTRRRSFLCYAVKCTGMEDIPALLTDMFAAAHDLVFKKGKLVCVPASAT